MDWSYGSDVYIMYKAWIRYGAQHCMGCIYCTIVDTPSRIVD